MTNAMTIPRVSYDVSHITRWSGLVASCEATKRHQRASARAVLLAAAPLKLPCSRRELMMGWARITIATEAGIVRMLIQRTPDVVQLAKPKRSPARTRRTSSGTKVVAMEIANRPCGSMKKVKALEYASWSPLPGEAKFLMMMRDSYFKY